MTQGSLKISIPRNDEWEPLDNPAAFNNQVLDSGNRRLRVVLPASATSTFRQLAELMSGPFYLLYLLHTPRGEASPGRYQSELIIEQQLGRFLLRFELFLARDARHDFWIKSASTTDLIIWTRHNEIYVYGETDKFTRKLIALGFSEQVVPKLGEHLHHYRQEFDQDAAAILCELNWTKSPLHPEDEQ